MHHFADVSFYSLFMQFINTSMLNKRYILNTFFIEIRFKVRRIVEVVRLPFFILTFTILHYRNAKTLFFSVTFKKLQEDDAG